MNKNEAIYFKKYMVDNLQQARKKISYLMQNHYKFEFEVRYEELFSLLHKQWSHFAVSAKYRLKLRTSVKNEFRLPAEHDTGHDKRQKSKFTCAYAQK